MSTPYKNLIPVLFYLNFIGNKIIKPAIFSLIYSRLN